MIKLKQVGSIMNFTVVDGKNEADIIIDNIDGNFWEKGGHKRLYLGSGKDKSYYDCKTRTFVLQSRTYKDHIGKLFPGYEMEY